MEVCRHQFSGTGTYQPGGGQVSIAGELKHHGRRATGTIHIWGDFGEINATGCHATHDWRAHTV